MEKLDFAQGYKMISGIVVIVVSVIVGSSLTSSEVAQVVSSTGQVIGGVLAIYGLVMKVYRYYKV